jgi:hypothetical protein
LNFLIVWVFSVMLLVTWTRLQYLINTRRPNVNWSTVLKKAAAIFLLTHS